MEKKLVCGKQQQPEQSIHNLGFAFLGSLVQKEKKKTSPTVHSLKAVTCIS